MTPTQDRSSAARMAWARAVDQTNIKWVAFVLSALVVLVIIFLSNYHPARMFFSQNSTERYRCEPTSGGEYAICRYFGPAQECGEWLPLVDCDYMFKAGYKICRLPSPSESEEIAKYTAVLTDQSRFCGKE